jgi:ELWxxDGT repeat protein
MLSLFQGAILSDSHQLQFLGSSDSTLLLGDNSGQLWRYDGKKTAASLNGKIFWTQEPAQSSEIWIFDGKIALMGDRLFFVALTPANSELWTSDGTAPGTRMVRDLAPGSFTYEERTCDSPVPRLGKFTPNRPWALDAGG